MNPFALAKNIRQSLRICPTWRDRVEWVRWLYSHDGRQRQIHFRFEEPVGDLKLVVRGNAGSDAFILGEVFHHRYYDFDLPQAPRTILDLGGHIGLTSIFFSRKYPRAEIACVEPMPGNLDCLRQNFALNGVDAKTYAAAIASDDGQLDMLLHDRDYGHTVATLDNASSGQRVSVRAIAVPTIMQELRWGQIDLLKVDIEGYERELLGERADWLKQVNAIAIECHGGYGDQELQALANTYGFLPPSYLPGITILLRHQG